MKTQEQIVVTFPAAVVAELKYLIRLCRGDPTAYAPETVEELIIQIMTAVADGSRRPGAWERDVISMLGLVSNRPEHHVYRPSYGDPAQAESGDDN